MASLELMFLLSLGICAGQGRVGHFLVIYVAHLTFQLIIIWLPALGCLPGAVPGGSDWHLGSVHTALCSLQRDCNEVSTRIVKDLRTTRPSVLFCAEAILEKGRWNKHWFKDRWFSDDAVHSATVSFPYASWRDVSGSFPSPSKFEALVVMLGVSLLPGDDATQQAIDKQLMMLTGSRICINLDYEQFPIKGVHGGHQLLALRRDDAQLPFISAQLYLLCCLWFPGLGTFYRLAFLGLVKRVKFNFSKEISLDSKSGAGWESSKRRAALRTGPK